MKHSLTRGYHSQPPNKPGAILSVVAGMLSTGMPRNRTGKKENLLVNHQMGAIKRCQNPGLPCLRFWSIAQVPAAYRSKHEVAVKAPQKKRPMEKDSPAKIPYIETPLILILMPLHSWAWTLGGQAAGLKVRLCSMSTSPQL